MEVQFLILPGGHEVYLHEPPTDLEISDQEYIVTRQVSQEEYARLTDNTLKEFKAYRFVEGPILSRYAPPAEINYQLLDLNRKEILDKGLRVVREYYASFDGTTYDDLVVRETHVYQYMPYRAIPIRLDIRIDWYLNDGTIGHTKVKTRFFVGTEGAKVHEKRKAANVMNVKAIIFELFTRHLGPETGLSRVNILFAYLFQTIETYVKGHEGFLIDAVAAYEEEVLDYPLHAGEGAPTIRQFLVAELDIPKYIPA